MSGPRTTAAIVYLTQLEAEALAQFVKRVGWNEICTNAAHREEAELMRTALEQLRRGLQDAGHDPR